jgi:hypothetical protein
MKTPKQLYKQLLRFKDTEHFKEFCFSKTGKHHRWMRTCMSGAKKGTDVYSYSLLVQLGFNFVGGCDKEFELFCDEHFKNLEEK